MKKQLLAIALVAMTTIASYAQGTIAFGNSALTKITIVGDGAAARNATTGDGLTIGVWYGSSADSLQQAAGTATIGSVAGVMVNAPSIFALAGTQPDQVVAVQIRAWNDRGWSGQTKVAMVTLGATSGPGTVVWHPNATVETRFSPLQVTVPEPTTIALGVLGLGSLLLFRRRK